MVAEKSTEGFSESAVESKPTIAQFFKGRSVLVTGGTGFVGKALVEKILRSCPEVDKIYLLVRPRKGRSAQERVEILTQQAIFDRLREERIGWEGHLVAVEGDVSAGSEDGREELDLSPGNRALLAERVSVIFHCAATVRFDDPLEDAVRMNVRGTYNLLRLAQEMKGLKVMVHISTTYCHTDRKILDEAVYPPPANWREMIWASTNLSPFELSAVTHKILGKLPNTYGFSKALAEQVVFEHRHKLPLLIFRPAIVSSAVAEPRPGWLDNFNGPVGLLVACGTGIVRSVYAKDSLVSDFSPVDITVKGIIVAAWDHATTPRPSPVSSEEEIETEIPKDGLKDPLLPVFNCTTAAVKTVTIGDIVLLARKLAPKTPFNDVLWYPGGGTTSSASLHFLYVIFLHLIPAFFIDTALRLRGKKPRLWRLQRRIYTANRALQYYLCHQWNFRSEKFSELSSKSLLLADREDFAHDVSGEDEEEYFRHAIAGARRFLLHQPESSLPAARAHMKRLYWMDRALRLCLALAVVYLAWPCFSMAMHAFQ